MEGGDQGGQGAEGGKGGAQDGDDVHAQSLEQDEASGPPQAAGAILVDQHSEEDVNVVT